MFLTNVTSVIDTSREDIETCREVWGTFGYNLEILLC